MHHSMLCMCNCVAVSILHQHLSPLCMSFVSPLATSHSCLITCLMLICNRSSMCQREPARPWWRSHQVSKSFSDDINQSSSLIAGKYVSFTVYQPQHGAHREVTEAHTRYRCKRWAWLKCFYTLICCADPAGYNFLVSHFYLPILSHI